MCSHFVVGVEILTVYLAAVLTFGFYLSAVPVKFALILRVTDHPGFGAGTSIFEGRFALRKANRRALGEKKHLPWKRADADLKKSPALVKISRDMLRRVRVEQLRIQGKIGLPDAAQTALICGFARAAEGALGACTAPGAVRFRLEPDFSGGGSDLLLWGMFSISAGHIILGALNGAWKSISDQISRRIPQWTSTPLKIS